METNKELLLKDLSARLPYNVKAQYYGIDEEDTMYDTIDSIYVIGNGTVEVGIGQYGLNIEDIKPYLFPLSSMTDGQKTEWDYIDYYADHHEAVDWLNKNHFDYRGLIEKSLALDATGLNIY